MKQQFIVKYVANNNFKAAQRNPGGIFDLSVGNGLIRLPAGSLPRNSADFLSFL
jgi:hypothetical protein